MDQLLQICTSLPKIELHAHLNGSIRHSTLCELSENDEGISRDFQNQLSSRGDRSLSDCFKVFDIIHKITTSTDVISRITREMCEDMAQDNVIYAEIRTTPKRRDEHELTKDGYVKAVLKGMREFEAQQATAQSSGLWTGSCAPLRTRLLLSIDRREGTEAAIETVQLAEKYRANGVVGIDLSGNPMVGQWDTWLPALHLARQAGLKITVHAGEVPNDAEVAAILKFAPDRLGHMCCMSEELEDQLLRTHIPLELCLTSNVKTESVRRYEDHHFTRLHNAGHPIALCTDDAGVFCTTLSQEFCHAAKAFNLNGEALLQLAHDAVPMIFAGDAVRNELIDIYSRWSWQGCI